MNYEAASALPIDSIEGDIAAASGNTTFLKSDIINAWVSSMSFRGTPDILWSCLVTLTACIYTAVHLNVPSAHESIWAFLGRKIKWVAVALFAPEILLYTAYAQLAEARRFVQELNALRFDNDGNAVVKEQPTQTEPPVETGSSENIGPITHNRPSTEKAQDAGIPFFIRPAKVCVKMERKCA